MPNDIVIKASGLSKAYKLYGSPQDRLKESLHPFRKKYHRDFFALNNVSFEIRPGETIGVIGRNGSGKSTLLKIITGVLNPSSGSVAVDGRISALLELGAGFNPELTGIENVYFNGTLIGLTKQEVDEKLDEILSFADIGDFIYQPVKTYSTGMFVRLAFASAISSSPDILIIDEALAVGDARFQLKCFKKLQMFQEENKVILFVSHDLGSVKRLCNRALLLEKGELLMQGLPNAVANVYSKLISDNGNVDEIKAEVARSQSQTLAEPTNNPVTSNLVSTEVQQRSKLLRLDEAQHQQVSSGEYSYGGEFGVIENIVVKDNSGLVSNVFTTGDIIKVTFDAHAFEDIFDPIYAMTIKDSRGQEIYGANTLFTDTKTTDVKAGERLRVTFTLPLNIMQGEYFISLGWTRFSGSDLLVIHRRYDVLKFTILPRDGCFGIANCFSAVSIESVAY